MKKNTKNSVLVIVIVCIIASIWYLESKKVPYVDPSLAPDVTTSLPSAPITGTTTAMKSSIPDRASIVAAKAIQYKKAKELVDPTGFVNTAPFKLSDYVGKKVILVDFWTYSCINCQRTIPYLNAWYQKYKDDGLLIVGIHTPEFGFEKDINNVSAAVKKLGIQYPVVLDSDQGTWNAYQNEYWPHEYLIDIDGYVVHDHIGEGDYDVTEQAIQKALTEREDVLGLHDAIPTTIVNPEDAVSTDDAQVKSPETYFGYARNQYLANGTITPGAQTFVLPATYDTNKLYLDGMWNFQYEYAETQSKTTKIIFPYNAKNVYFVASAKTPVKIKILRDGVPITAAEAGSDVASDGTITVQENRLYNLIKGATYGAHTVELDVQGAGLDAYTFTFG